MEKILVIGAAGQIGSELTLALRKVYGDSNVFATDIKDAPKDVKKSGPFQLLDVMDDKRLIHFVIRYKITQIYILAAVLSGNAERLPLQAWDINMRSILNILDLAREVGIGKIFWPSSIAVFGTTTPKADTPQLTVMEPNTVYGISKLAGERWCEYYFNKHGLDVRSIRYPGLISYKTEAGGGTTDYAVEIFDDAVESGKYECFLKPKTKLPMMFMDDAIRATIELMEADSDKLTIRSSYNISGISFDPEELAGEIKKSIPDFKIIYKPDFRQAIAESWPQSIDDSVARHDWGWKHKIDLEKMTKIMLKETRKKFKIK
ncbi:MAG TPA: NAD-dependent epimerase/dehydratase family protein [Ignavibacteria bacterium]|nr:NAD-dependent epimerase/dehydratase family protein [Ignavibacteria bacterium]HQY52330.1 NAD-dependent epimerase/dehydratase family protein [Ignavibacteria bacterium]HRA99486.1 NAD-dependent epimerase/dehydratase family protein [Ignavibacteria bacterium]